MESGVDKMEPSGINIDHGEDGTIWVMRRNQSHQQLLRGGKDCGSGDDDERTGSLGRIPY